MEILSRLEGVKGGGGQYSARCPNHGDRHNSLSVSIGNDGRVLLNCHAGCNPEDIVGSMGLTMKDLFAEVTPGEAFPTYNTPRKQSGARFEAEYIYHDAKGKPLLKKVKMREADGGKFCFWQRPEGDRWVKGRGSIEPPLYTSTGGGALPGGVFLVEGEKDVDTIRAIGKAAASLPDGAKSKWHTRYGEALKGRKARKIICKAKGVTMYYKTCPHCGANLDPGEKCDCPKAQKETAPGATNTESGKAEQTTQKNH